MRIEGCLLWAAFSFWNELAIAEFVSHAWAYMNIIFKVGLSVLMGAGFAFAIGQALAALHG